MKFGMSPPPRDSMLGEREYSDLVVYVRLNGDLAETVRKAAIACNTSNPDIIRRALEFWAARGASEKFV